MNRPTGQLGVVYLRVEIYLLKTILINDQDRQDSKGMNSKRQNELWLGFRCLFVKKFSVSSHPGEITVKSSVFKVNRRHLVTPRLQLGRSIRPFTYHHFAAKINGNSEGDQADDHEGHGDKTHQCDQPHYE